MNPFEFYWKCVESASEIDGRPLDPYDVVMSFSGYGASATVLAGDVRKMLREHREMLEQRDELAEILKRMVNCQCPVSIAINSSGWGWDESCLDYLASEASELLAKCGKEPGQ